jgi:hypothetical protein
MITRQIISTSEIVIGSISAIACLLVVLTYFIFKDIRCLRCVELSVYVALSDMLGSTGLAIGAQKSYSVACTFQTLLHIIQSSFRFDKFRFSNFLTPRNSLIVDNNNKNNSDNNKNNGDFR